MTDFRNRRSRRPRLASVTVTGILPSKYPQFCQDRENPYSTQPEDVRLAEITDFCGSMLAQAALIDKAVLRKTKVA